MQTENIYETKKAAKRFNNSANALLQKLNDPTLAGCGGRFPVEFGALRRASLDLTRALAKMRRP